MSNIKDLMDYGENALAIDYDDGRKGSGVGIEQKAFKMPSTIIIANPSDNTDNTTVVVIIFIVISALCGLICFLTGSAVGGRCGYIQGRKSEKRKESDDQV